MTLAVALGRKATKQTNVSYIIEDRNPIFWCVDATLDGLSVMYHFRDTVTLTSDQVCNINVSRTSLPYILFEIKIPNVVCGCNLGWC